MSRVCVLVITHTPQHQVRFMQHCADKPVSTVRGPRLTLRSFSAVPIARGSPGTYSGQH